MKKTLLFILTLIVAITLCSFASVTALAEGATPYSLAEEYANAHPVRDSLSGGEAAAAESLSNALTSYGYAVTTTSFSSTATTETNAKVTFNHPNVVGYKDNGKGECILIGCFYSGYSTGESGATGGTVALSVGTLLYIAEALSTAMLEYDVAIGFWGGVEVMDNFDASKCGVDLDRIALYINLDSVAAGRYDYIYADDLPRESEKYFRSVADELDVSFEENPLYKRPLTVSTLGIGFEMDALGKRAELLCYGENDPYDYAHLGLLSANRFFMGKNIPCVSFLSGEWESAPGLYRYDGKKEIEGTELDTIKTIDERNGGADKTAARLLGVANVVISGVTRSEIKGVIEKSRKEVSSASLDNTIAYYAITFGGMGLLIGVLLFLLLKQRKDRRDTEWNIPGGPRGGERETGGKTGREEEKNPFEEFRPEEKPSSSGSGNNDVDDIFRF